MKLVRFSGMVQNILDHEYVSTVVLGKEISTGLTRGITQTIGKQVLVPCKYRDNVEAAGVDFEGAGFQDSLTEERGKMVCAGITCQSPWVSELAHFTKDCHKLIAYVRSVLVMLVIRRMTVLEKT